VYYITVFAENLMVGHLAEKNMKFGMVLMEPKREIFTLKTNLQYVIALYLLLSFRDKTFCR